MPLAPRTMTGRNLRLVALAHPFELALGAALALNGLRGLLGSVSPSVDALAELPRILYLAVSSLGGIGVIVGLILNDPPRHFGLGKAIEQASLYLVAASYAVLALIIVAGNGWPGVATALVSLVVGGACLLRAHAIALTSAIILEELTARNTQNTRDEAPDA